MRSGPLRVLHVVNTDRGGGVLHVMRGLVSDQIARGWQVHVALPATGAAAAHFRALGATIHPWEGGRLPGRSTLRELRELRGVVDVVDPQVVHLHSTMAGFVGRLVLRGRSPTVFWPHAWSFHAVAGVVRRLAIFWERWALRWTSVVVCVSASEAAEGRAAGIGGRLAVCANGVDLRRFRPVSVDERVRLRQRLGVDVGPLAVCVGRVCPQKGQDVAVAAWPLVRQRVADATLVLVGAGHPDEREPLPLGEGVQRVPWTDEVAAWLAAADVVVLPSRWEGLSIALLEAMACGTCVVATDVAGVCEAFESAHGVGADAVVVVDDVAGLATAVADRLSDATRRAVEGKGLRAVCEARYDQRRQTGEVAALTETLAGAEREAVGQPGAH